jgi:hypothetical protein
MKMTYGGYRQWRNGEMQLMAKWRNNIWLSGYYQRGVVAAA